MTGRRRASSRRWPSTARSKRDGLRCASGGRCRAACTASARRCAGPARWLERNVDLAEPLPAAADIVVSTGPSTAATNIAVARAVGARNIYCGFPKRPQLGVTALLTPVPSSARCAVFVPRPTDIDVARLRRPTSLREPGPRRLALLMGGNSKHYAYTERDMTTLAQALREILAAEPEWTFIAYEFTPHVDGPVRDPRRRSRRRGRAREDRALRAVRPRLQRRRVRV